MINILDFTSFINEAENVYSGGGDPYSYKVINGEWWTKGPRIPNWKSIGDNVRATQILDTRYPGTRGNVGIPNPTQVSSIYQSNTSNQYNPQTSAITQTSKDIMVCSHAARWDGPGGTKVFNSIKNFELNVKNGTDMIEVDIQITADGVPVLYHDGTLDARTSAKGKIQNKNWAEVKNISYDEDPKEKIPSLAEAVRILKTSNKTKLQLDKCDASELAIIHKLGLLKGIENRVIAKGTSYTPPAIIRSMGIQWMPIIPGNMVGSITDQKNADSVVAKCSPGYLEYQFSDSDTYVTNGYLSDALRARGVMPLVVAVGGTDKTNGKSFRGDGDSAWNKMITQINPSVIMTNSPKRLRDKINSTR